MPDQCDFELEGISLQLLGRGGLYWSTRQTLFVADTHFGKEATFRRSHIPVPTGSTAGTLAAITAMIQQTGAQHLVVLGDMFHARSSLSPQVCDTLEVFFERHPGLSLRLVRGNHDRHVGTLPGAWPIEVVGDYQLGPIALSHHPGILPEGAELLLCGHLHPAIRLAAAKEQIGKLPCFWLSGGRLVLPAVGEFTGTHVIRPAPGDRVWLLVDGQVVEYRRPTRRRGRRLV